MNILIAGGTGLIGRPLIRSLVSSGHQIVVLSRNSPKHSNSPSVEFLHWDGENVPSWGSSVNHVEAVINLAGENIGSFPWTRKRKQLFRKSRIKAGNALVNAIQIVQPRPSIFIQASAVGFYGPHGDERIDETSGSGTDYSARLCIDWEGSSAGVEEMGIRRIIIRTGVVLERSGGVLPLMALPVRLFAGGRLGKGNQGIPWIHIDDEVNAIKFLLENDSARGVYNLSAPNPTSNSAFMKTLASVLKRPYWFHVPQSVIRFALGEMSTLLLNGQYMIPSRLLNNGFKFIYETLGLALQDILNRA
jgi:uncharacterized protein (TIGR01777 family)